MLRLSFTRFGCTFSGGWAEADFRLGGKMWIETPWSVSLTVNGGGRSELGKICRRFTLFFQDKLFLMHFFFFFFQGRTSVDKEGVHTQVFGCGRMAVNQKSEFCLHFLVLLGMKPSFN